MLRLTLLLAVTLYLTGSVQSLAQTSAELNQKLGRPISATYVIKPDLLVTATCLESDKPCDLRITARPPSGGAATREMSEKLADQIIDELIPVQRRGELIGESSAEFGRNGLFTSVYEHVEIRRATAGYGMPEPTIKFIEVVWKESGKGDK